MGVISRYIDINNTKQVIGVLRNLGIQNAENLENYRDYYEKSEEETISFINDKLNKFIISNLESINNEQYDINYCIEQINKFLNKKFYDILKILCINSLVCKNENYNNSKNGFYFLIKNKFYNEVYNKILKAEFKLANIKQSKMLIDIINDNWSNINFDNIVGLSQSLKKIKTNNTNIEEYIKIYEEKFDNKANIIKLINYITEKLINNDRKNKEESYNICQIVDMIKSNGFLLFEEYHKSIIEKYKNSVSIDELSEEKMLNIYFRHIISSKESNNVNRYANEKILIIRKYLDDLWDNYHNNINYKKITVKQVSEKYKNLDLSNYNRNNTSFNIFRYSHINKTTIQNYILNDKISPYFDIYKSYYDSRYPDREIEFDILKSTTIVKATFLEKTYYIHMAIIQYLVMESLFNNIDGQTIIEISKSTGISPQHLQDTINSLLKIKLIKHDNNKNNKNIEDIIFTINYGFEYDKNKISISSMILKNEESEEKKQFLHDRDTIVLANLYDYIKKNKYCLEDILLTELQYKIPFKLTLEHIQKAIKTAISKEHIKAIETQINGDHIQIMYQLVV
jgi:hypothetical protein